MREPKPVETGEPLVICPHCRGDQPKTSVRLLRNYPKRKNGIENVVDGEKILCEECGAIFNLCYRTGVFGKVEHSLPQVMQYQNSTVTAAETPHKTPTKVEGWTPRQRTAGV